MSKKHEKIWGCSRNCHQFGVIAVAVAKARGSYEKRGGTGLEAKTQVMKDFVSSTKELDLYLKG